ncbi:MAG: hypothetical protein ACPGTO_03125 [Polaribacter sp.]
MNLQLIAAAKRLGKDKDIMSSYWKYHERMQNWFFSPNPNLDGACERPTSFDGWVSWFKLSTKQKMTLAALAGFKSDATDIQKTKAHFSKLKEAYMDKWRTDLYSIFWANEESGNLWLCNLFVGDAIYFYNRKSFTSGNKHYFDPKQISNGESFLKKRRNYEEVQAGDICVFGKHHVEIIIKIHNNWISDDGFCSIGAGRGVNPNSIKGDGKKKCNSFFANATREINNNNNSYYYI